MENLKEPKVICESEYLELRKRRNKLRDQLNGVSYLEFGVIKNTIKNIDRKLTAYEKS